MRVGFRFPAASVEPAADLAQQPLGVVARRAGAGPCNVVFERLDGGAEIVELDVERPRLAPQMGVLGREQQHRLDRAERTLDIAALYAPGPDVVLETNQHVAIADRLPVPGLELGLDARRRLQKTAQPGGVENVAAVERIDDPGRAAEIEADDEMTREREPRRVPSLRPVRTAETSKPAPPMRRTAASASRTV